MADLLACLPPSVASCIASPLSLLSSLLGGRDGQGGPSTSSIASSLKLNGRTFDIVKLLGEGGFSFVYLARDRQSGRLFALKKIRCPYGSTAFQDAMAEMQATKRFRSPHIIRVFDSCVQTERSTSNLVGSVPSSAPDDGPAGSDRVVYLFLPYYAKGNLQDAINAHALDGTRFSEKDMLTLFRGTCVAVNVMHTYHLADVRPTAPASQREEVDEPIQDGDAAHDDDAPLIQAGSGAPLSLGQEATEGGGGGADSEYPPRPRDGGEKVPYAHRDIKPANVMISNEGTPILMDFGSTMKARIHIPTRREAVEMQDLAAERSSMPYRAPELFDVRTDSTLTESVDVWSLGCLLYACAYLHSPFETAQTVEQGGSIALAVLNGAYDLPSKSLGLTSGAGGGAAGGDAPSAAALNAGGASGRTPHTQTQAPSNDPYSQRVRDMIRDCLDLDASKRPTVAQLIERTDVALAALEG